MIAKCPCQNCNGHIEFEADGFQPGTTTQCPLCKLETVLFIPPIAGQAKPTPRLRKGRNVMVLTIASVAILLSALWAARLLSPAGAKHSPIEQKIQASLKPVVGAFGWKLGEKLPTQFASKVRYSMYSFKPETEMPPFELFDLELLNDGRIYGVRAEGFVHGYLDFSGAKERLISLLTEKYGLRQHNPKNLLGDDEYIFGSEDHAACLQVR